MAWLRDQHAKNTLATQLVTESETIKSDTFCTPLTFEYALDITNPEAKTARGRANPFEWTEAAASLAVSRGLQPPVTMLSGGHMIGVRDGRGQELSISIVDVLEAFVYRMQQMATMLRAEKEDTDRRLQDMAQDNKAMKERLRIIEAHLSATGDKSVAVVVKQSKKRRVSTDEADQPPRKKGNASQATSAEEKTACIYCGKLYAANTMRPHIHACHSTRWFECPCGYRTRKKTNVDRHMSRKH
jgi:hypothetical protein